MECKLFGSYFQVVLFVVLDKAVLLSFESVDEILKCDLHVCAHEPAKFSSRTV